LEDGMNLALGYVGLEVSDLGAWRRFASDMLGLAIGAPRSDGALPLRMDGHDHRFLLHEGPADDLAYVGWEVADAAALGELRGRLVKAKVPVSDGTAAELKARGVKGLIRFTDPSGIRSEIYFGPEMGRGDFKSAKVASGYLTEGMGMGHVLISVRSAEETERFYREVLGFRLSDYVDFDLMGHTIHAVFLHVNPRHHSLAFAQIPGPKRINHFMLQTKGIDDVGSALYRAQDLGIPMARTLGRHQNDRMISFYGVTPSGFHFEVGWGAREIDDRDWEIKTYGGVSDWGHRLVAPH
jgi:2,3-dihydroxybiphenyl 1,2-dioxygenase